MYIRVGLDQWIMVNGNRVGFGQSAQRIELNTAGLSGCVAIGMSWGHMISLAHVYSGCTAATWIPADGSAGYLQALNEAFAGSRALMLKGRPEAVLYWSEGTPNWLPRQLYDWLDARDIQVNEELAPTCRIWLDDDGRFKWSANLTERPDDVRNYTTSANAAATIQFYKGLSANAAPATPPQGE